MRLTDQQPHPTAADDPGDESEKSLSLMSGVIRPEGLPELDDGEVTALRGPGRLLSLSSMLVVGALVLVVLLLVALRAGRGQIVAGADASDLERKIEATLAKLTNPAVMADDDPLRAENITSLFRDTASIVNILSEDHTAHQVPIEYVKKNPFALAIYKPAVDDSGLRHAAAQSARLKKLQQEFAAYKLQTIMKGRPNIAVINGEFYREGQTIGSFTVQKIEQMGVTLAADGQAFALTMASAK
jgi:hypothetical protein